MSKSKSFGLAELDDEERKDVVATLFVLILQIFGRLARVTDVTKPEPHVYFIDGAFRGREDKQSDFDCLSELGRYLDALMTQKESAEIAETLYVRDILGFFSNIKISGNIIIKTATIVTIMPATNITRSL